VSLVSLLSGQRPGEQPHWTNPLSLLRRRFLAFYACDARGRLPFFPDPQSSEADVMGEELWYVKLANGDVHRVTIDQLDGAFQAGHIDEGTMVLAAGANQWTKLGELAGLGDDEPPAPEADEPEITYVPQVHTGPISYVPQIQAAPYVAPVRAAPAPVAQRAAPVGYVPQVSAVPQASYVPQVQQAVASRTPYAVAVSPRPAPVAAPYVPNSLRPMSMDLGELDLDMPFQRKSRAGRFAVAVIALAAVAGGAGFAAQRAHIGMGSFGGGSDLSNVAAAAAIAAPPPVADPVIPPPAPAPLPAAAVPASAPATVSAANAAPAQASPMNPQFTSRLNEDTTKKLLSADKARESKSKTRHSGGGGAAPSSHTKSTTFTTGGNKFDPLNSAI